MEKTLFFFVLFFFWCGSAERKKEKKSENTFELAPPQMLRGIGFDGVVREGGNRISCFDPKGGVAILIGEQMVRFGRPFFFFLLLFFFLFIGFRVLLARPRVDFLRELPSFLLLLLLLLLLMLLLLLLSLFSAVYFL